MDSIEITDSSPKHSHHFNIGKCTSDSFRAASYSYSEQQTMLVAAAVAVAVAVAVDSADMVSALVLGGSFVETKALHPPNDHCHKAGTYSSSTSV